MKRIKIGLVLAILTLSFLSTNAYAALQVIGTAEYQANTYKLIYMEDSPFGPITWLDYTNPETKWQTQKDWASGLGSELAVTLYDGYDDTGIDWTAGWRLPETVNGFSVIGYDDTFLRGYNITTSEMGYLFYEELGNAGEFDTNGDSLEDFGLENTGDFDNLLADRYWSETYYQPNHNSLAWGFEFDLGYQHASHQEYNYLYGLAVHSGDISAVPIPGAVWLLGSGILGLMGLRRKRVR
ncbi:MAG: VPLPA-CTERM sorting domain-containing protein [Desulfobacteraceae bacterium]|jgi:hypothetical protein